MDPVFLSISSVTLVSAIAAMSLRNLVHCALFLVVCLASLALLYLHLDAQFVGFAQILVYVGAVAILIVFALLLTRNIDFPNQSPFSRSWVAGLVIALIVLGALVSCILSSSLLRQALPSEPQVTVRSIGELLMTNYVLPLEVIALLLTVSLIGAVVLAMQEQTEPAAKEPMDKSPDNPHKAFSI